MLGFIEKARNVLLVGNQRYDDEQEQEYEYEEEAVEEIIPLHNKRKETIRNVNVDSTEKVTRIFPELKVEIVLAKPGSLEEARTVADNVVNNNVCVVNLEGIEKERAQRIVDFLSGACYALNGSIDRISNEIFIMSPNGVNVSEKTKTEAKSSSSIFPWITPMR